MKAPGFWYSGGPTSLALAPLGGLWAAGASLRGAFHAPAHAPVPVVCIGNIVVGGAGKTPVAMSLAHRLPGAQFLSRGYGGNEIGPILVDPDRDDHRQVGDEPLLLARIARCWVARDRAAGAQAAALEGASCVIMDDGYQDPGLAKDISLLVVDGHVGFGNGRCIPAGPLREPVERGLSRAQAIVLLGEDRVGVTRQFGGVPVLRGMLEPETEAQALHGQRVVAFAGIGRPAKFFHTLEKLGATLVETRSFPDHHPYTPVEIGHLVDAAELHAAALMTTTKDYVRVPAHQREHITVLRVAVTWEDEAALMRVLAPILKAAR
ncbi:MAG TPA: tetraacyldisaccharide 4'-kinase [Magnetospirillaceae bacterium]